MAGAVGNEKSERKRIGRTGAEQDGLIISPLAQRPVEASVFKTDQSTRRLGIVLSI